MPSVGGVWREHVAHHDALDDIRAVSHHARGVLWCHVIIVFRFVSVISILFMGQLPSLYSHCLHGVTGS